MAAGTVLLAGRPDAEVDAVSYRASEPEAAAVGRSGVELAGRLEHVRAGGLIGDFRAGNGGACALAAPVVDAARSVVAALSVQAPRARWQVHRREFTVALCNATLRLTAKVAQG